MANLPPEAAALILVLLVVVGILILVAGALAVSLFLLRRRVLRIEDAFRAELDDDRDWPWCEDCGSYHHPANPDCVRGAPLRVPLMPGPLRELESIIGGTHAATYDPLRSSSRR